MSKPPTKYAKLLADFNEQRDEARAEVQRLTRERNIWRKLAETRAILLARAEAKLSTQRKQP